MEYIDSRLASENYTNAMQTVLDGYIGKKSRFYRSSCRQAKPRPSNSWPIGILKDMSRYLFSWRHGEEQYLAEDSLSKPDIHPIARSFLEELNNTEPFSHMSRKQKSRLSVALAFPGWLTETEELCQIMSVASELFGTVFAAEHPTAAYTAMGYDFCRTPDDAYDCQGPGRLTTIDIQNDHSVFVAQSRTPMSGWMPLEVRSAVYQDATEGAAKMVDWVELFISTLHSDLVMITGPGTASGDHHLRHLIMQSPTIAPLLINQSLIPSDRVVAMGAAQFAKDSLERRFDGCWELPECLDIRREADRIAGKFAPLITPTKWSLTDIRKGHEVQQAWELNLQDDFKELHLEVLEEPSQDDSTGWFSFNSQTPER